MSKPTLFEDLRQEVDVEPGRSPFFFEKAFRRLSKRYAADPQRLIRDEMRDRTSDNPDDNMIRRFPKQGHLFMFEYSSEKDNVSVFDPFPLVFVISVDGSSFLGCNLFTFIH